MAKPQNLFLKDQNYLFKNASIQIMNCGVCFQRNSQKTNVLYSEQKWITVSQEDKTHANSTTNSYYEILNIDSNGLVNHLLLRGEVMEESQKPDWFKSPHSENGNKTHDRPELISLHIRHISW